MDIVDKIKKFCNSDINSKQKHDKWLAGPKNNVTININELENIGNNCLGVGVNCSEYNKYDTKVPIQGASVCWFESAIKKLF